MNTDPFGYFPKHREKWLKSLYRYSSFDLMFYRPNLWDHCHRVSWLVEELAPHVRKHFPKFDVEKARVMALVHDDAERFTGDIQSRVKVRASKQQAAKMHADEAKAIEKVSKLYPKMVGKFVYKDLLLEMLHRTSVESQVVTYADKMDAYCESLHELFAGNFTHLQTILFYPRVMAFLDSKFKLLAPIVQDKRSVFTDLERYLDVVMVKNKVYRPFNKPFTQKTVRLSSTIPFYDAWREMVLRRGGREGMRMLTKQREFLRKRA